MTAKLSGELEPGATVRDQGERVPLVVQSEQVINRLAATFKVLGDPTRTRIVLVLSRAELCVGELAAHLGLSMSAVSHQLRILRNFELVKVRKEGKMAYYSLDDDHIDNLFAEGLRHVER